MRINSRRGARERLGELRDRARLLGDEVQNLLLRAIRQELMLSDRSPRLAVAAAPRRDAFTWETKPAATLWHGHKHPLFTFPFLGAILKIVPHKTTPTASYSTGVERSTGAARTQSSGVALLRRGHESFSHVTGQR